MEKKKLATVWLGGCSGCHMSLLDIDERILEVAKLADIVKCPVVDGKELPEVDIHWWKVPLPAMNTSMRSSISANNPKYWLHWAIVP